MPGERRRSEMPRTFSVAIYPGAARDVAVRTAHARFSTYRSKHGAFFTPRPSVRP